MNILTKLRQDQPPLQAPKWIVFGVGLAVLTYLAYSPLISAPYINFERSMVMIYLVVGLGLNLLTGYTGQISLGHGAFFALGAYLAAITTGKLGWHYAIAFPLVAVMSWFLGYFVGRPALRLQGLQLALVTLALALVTPSIIKRFDTFTKGQEGLNLNTAHPPTWIGLERDQWTYYLCLLFVVIALLLTHRLATGRVGRSLMAIRDNEPVAATLGVRAATVKTQIFALSTAFAGVAGVLYAYVVQFVAPDAFGLTLAIAFITLIVVGGLGSTFGTIFGALFVVYVPNLTSEISESAAGLSYGVALVLFMFILPFGIISFVRLGLTPLVARLPKLTSDKNN